MAVGVLLSPGGSVYFTRKQNMKLVTTKFKSGGLHEKHVVANVRGWKAQLRERSLGGRGGEIDDPCIATNPGFCAFIWSSEKFPALLYVLIYLLSFHRGTSAFRF